MWNARSATSNEKNDINLSDLATCILTVGISSNDFFQFETLSIVTMSDFCCR